MPTFTAITLDWLLEPGTRYPATTKQPQPQPQQKAPIKVENPPTRKSVPPRPNISPALYATPETTQLPDSPSSFPPSSPYIVNHKRRGPRLLKSSQNDLGGPHSTHGGVVGASGGAEASVEGLHDRNIDDELKSGYARVAENEAIAVQFHEEHREDTVVGDKLAEVLELATPLGNDAERDTETEDFFDPQDSLSTTSNSEFEDGSSNARWRLCTPLGEYYDAVEEISSDGTAQSLYLNIEDELHEMRLNLLMEIERRKQAEEALDNMQNKWQMLSHHLSLVGLMLPASSTLVQEQHEQSQYVDPVKDLCQQVVVSRAVADAVARACSRADVEMEMQPQIESKNFEIARLWDRLHYYEAANREMSQRNQEAIEMARRRRHMRKRRQRWFWSSVGLVLTLGAAAVAWSYIPGSVPSASEGDGKDAQ